MNLSLIGIFNGNSSFLNYQIIKIKKKLVQLYYIKFIISQFLFLWVFHLSVYLFSTVSVRC